GAGISGRGSTWAISRINTMDTIAVISGASRLAQSTLPPFGKILRSGSTSQLVTCSTALDTGLYGGILTTCSHARSSSAAPNNVKTVLSKKRAISPNILLSFPSKYVRHSADSVPARSLEAGVWLRHVRSPLPPPWRVGASPIYGKVPPTASNERRARAVRLPNRQRKVTRKP